MNGAYKGNDDVGNPLQASDRFPLRRMLILEISCKPINKFLDFNVVIVNLESMEKEQQRECLDNIESNINVLKSYLEENIAMKENAPDIPATGMAVLQQQFLLVQAIEEWIATLKKELG